MKISNKQVRKLLRKPKISDQTQQNLRHFDMGANYRAHQYSKLKTDHYDALSLLKELVKESNYDYQVNTTQSHLLKTLRTNHDSLNFDLLSLDRLGLINVDVGSLAKDQDHFSCKIIAKHVFDNSNE